MSINIRTGTEKDSDWIAKLLQGGAQEGHFGSLVSAQANNLLKSIFDNGGVQFLKLRGGITEPTFVKMYIDVVELDGDNAAFLITAVQDDGIELHLAGVLKNHRRKGCFLALVEHAKKKWGHNHKVYARCYKKSTWAKAALAKAGFSVTKGGNPEELTYQI